MCGMAETPPSIGKVLRGVRLLRGLRQVDIARRVGISPTLLSQIERGWRRPSFEQVDRISAALREGGRREDPA